MGPPCEYKYGQEASRVFIPISVHDIQYVGPSSLEDLRSFEPAENNFASQLSWNNISANNERFIEAQRRPRDARDQPVILMNPAAMPVETHLNPWWDFMHNCAKGQVSDEKVFGWKPETTRLAIPSIQVPANPDVHQSGELSRTANLKKRPRDSNAAARKSRKGKSKARPMSDEPNLDLEEDVDGLIEDAENAGQGEDEVVSTRVLRTRKTSNLIRVQTSTGSTDSNEDDSFESGSEDSNGQTETNGRSGKTRAISLRSRSTRLRVLSPEPQDAIDSTPADTTSPRTLPSQSLHDNVPTELPRDQPPAEASHVNNCQPEEAPSPSRKASEVGPARGSSGGPQTDSTATSTGSIPDGPHANAIIPNPCAVGASGAQARVDSTLDDISETAGKTTLDPSPGPAAGDQASLPEPPLKPSDNANVAARPFPGNSSGNRKLSPTRLQPYTEILLGHPHMFTGEGAASGSPGWLQVR